MIGQPDPKCRWCKGTGQVLLFTSSCKCDCTDKKTSTDFLIKDMEFLENSMFRYDKYPDIAGSQGVKK